MQTTSSEKQSATLYYDGDCAFCTWCAKFIERRDTHKRFTLVPIQNSEHAAEGACYESIIFMNGDYQSQYSRAVVDVLTTLGGFWWLLGWLLWLVPRPIRDWVYRFVGKRRHWLTGKPPTC